MTKHVRVYTDGGARGNPGPARSGAVIKALHDDCSEGETIAVVNKFLGHATNNIAEYEAVIIGLTKARELDAEKVELVMDSELVVKQLKGEYRVKNPDLAQKFLQVHNLVLSFKEFTVRHVLREKNKEADALVNDAIDKNTKRLNYV